MGIRWFTVLLVVLSMSSAWAKKDRTYPTFNPPGIRDLAVGPLGAIPPPDANDPNKECKNYFNQTVIKKVPAEQLRDSQNLWETLCEARPFAPAPGPGPPVKIKADLIKAVLDFNLFDAARYERISIANVRVEGPLVLTRTHIFNDLTIAAEFSDGIDLSYSSTAHNIDLRGSSFPKGICLKGFQTQRSIFFKFPEEKPLPESPPEEFSQQDVCVQEPSNDIKNHKGVRNYINLNEARVDGVVEIKGDRTYQPMIRGIHNHPRIGMSAVYASIGSVNIEHVDLFDIDFENLTSTSVALTSDYFCPLSQCWKAEAEPTCSQAVASTASMDGAKVAKSIVLDRSTFVCPLSATAVRVGGDISFRGTSMLTFDLTGSQADGDLISSVISSPDQTPDVRFVTWLKLPPSKTNALILDHASVNLLRVTPSSWPNASAKDNDGVVGWKAPPSEEIPGECSSVERSRNDKQRPSLWSIFWRDWLYGKTYRPGTLVSMTDFHFKAFALPYYCLPSESAHFFVKDNTLDADNIVHWLEVSKYSPSVFSLVQDLLKASGQEYDARRIGFIDKSIQAQLHWDDVKNGKIRAIPAIVVSTFTRWFIGYGYCIYAAATWAVVLLLFGTFVFWLIPSNGLVEDKQEDKVQNGKPTPKAPSLRSEISPSLTVSICCYRS